LLSKLRGISFQRFQIVVEDFDNDGDQI